MINRVSVFGKTGMGKKPSLTEFPELDILKRLTKEESEVLLDSLVTEKYTKGRVIFESDDPAKLIYIIREGKVKTFTITEFGEEVILLIFGQGDLFGFSSIYGQGKRFVFAAAIEDTVLYGIPIKIFENTFKTNPEFAFEVFKMVGLRLCYFRKVVEDLATRNAKSRLAKILMEFVEKSGIPSLSGTFIGVALSHEDIGNIISVSRQKVTTLLNIFEKEKLIKKRRKQIFILDKKGLADLI